MEVAAEDGSVVTGRSGSPRFRKLKPRPGHAGRNVAEHQRGRLHAATIELVAEQGYPALTVTGITRAAGVSSHTFYENFAGKSDCFLATYDLVVRCAACSVLRERQRVDGGRRITARVSLSAFADGVTRHPQAARLALIEAFDADSATGRMRHTEGLFEALAVASFSEPADLPPLVAKGIVAGVSHVARRRLLARQEKRLTGDVDPLADWALALQDDLVRQVLPGHNGGVPARRLGADRDGPRSVLLSSDRETILSVVARLAATEGYEALTVTRVCRGAGISRRRFDRQFESVRDCFLAALELRAGHVFAAARAAHRGAATWPSGVCRAVRAICDEIAVDPVLARLVFSELPAPGCEALRWRVRFVARFAAALQGSAPPEQRPSELAAEASVAAAWGVMCDYGTTGRARSLSQLADLLAYFALAPALGAEAAVEAVREEEKGPSRPGKATADRLHREAGGSMQMR